MVDKADIVDAIKNSPGEAAAALLAIQAGSAAPVSMDAIKAAADALHQPVETIAADEIERLNLNEAFALALKARGVMIDIENVELKDTQFPPDLLRKFLSRGEAFRCRIAVDRNVTGSGCLIGPSLVLTAWHVIATAPPGQTDPADHLIEVLLSDSTRRRAAAKPYYVSTSTGAEFLGDLPTKDDDFKGFNDVALIKLERPDGSRLGFASLPSPSPDIKSRSSIMLLHFPQGADLGFGFGKISKAFPKVTARWAHDVDADAGSSGGPCFNTRFALVGLHQGKFVAKRRLVPVKLFADDIRQLVERDVAPPLLWSLDGTIQGPLVVGRDLFFEAVAAATRPASRVRGVRVKRRDVTQGSTGLAFSLEMLMQVLARNPGAHRTIRINFEPPYIDLIDDIRQRARAAGLDIPPVEAGAGARVGETTLEAAINDRSRNLAVQLNAASDSSGQLLWFLFDNPPVGLNDAERYTFEGFIGAALKQPRLRLALAGYETISTPGEEFVNAGMADTDGAPGVVVEYFGLFSRGDVEQLLKRACQDLGLTVDPAVITDRASQILLGLNSINGQYSAADLQTVGGRATQQLASLQQVAGAQP
ncbi:trypsin-like serine peptidase [uncultured Bradyrhizobium sp.]|uniref:trypsin-like serine peptidase n=1 Tax=uncultured Bradyrhizobium sp. TaxID=199684 RepID=UPI0035C957C3